MEKLPYEVICSKSGRTSLKDYLEKHGNEYTALLDLHGAIIFRGFQLDSVDDFRHSVQAVTPDIIDYTEPSTPRTQIASKIFTSTEYPADQRIPLHNEMSYRRTWPQYLWFWVQTAAKTGGQTTLADYRKVLNRLPVEIINKFENKGVAYERRYNTGFDLTWQHVFQTDDRDIVENRLLEEGIEFDWIDENILYTKQVVQGVLTHPRTRIKSWFNQANLFHPSSLKAEIRAALEAALGKENIPRMAKYGDGSPIEEQTLKEIRVALDEETVYPNWQSGDVAIVDNLAIAHGREPFIGYRKVYVMMANPMHSTFNKLNQE
ncbi:TauD/TfdA family dioxygenase [Photorhabdus temperata]|uniref:Putative taurine catabolism dioxygenase n=1 Tax=Photorhabdus temperata subsp. temperata Meg1 TaxID=1393735 RepID=A0A081RZ69_PHOTE|nr:TauD/TfdA family dioxygenase [Photorhabdus temperata]EQC00391.1 hypothetical protein B738_11580 [Photorhabdus temperata subsp. temperata M1021]KER03972.1 putative taurine catabolism dioxygenase [Photorhabdus temperata subsp. temperata Meg1]MCT8347118.1 TauD/TfdA family dioxygenase [Photorhabdus temperata]